ncbi:hypothetical protein HYR99_17620 [Candidatus Poribacteria bacterium]|nr:hypothetical protein [Candidatus Poribacteria bacterium]
MENKRIADIETTEFDTLIDAFIEREMEDTGELRAPLFYETLEAIFQNPADATTVELQAQVVDSELQLILPPSTPPGVKVHDNEITVNHLRFVIHLMPSEMMYQGSEKR